MTKLVKYVEFLGYGAVAKEIKNDKRVKENIDFLIEEFGSKQPEYFKFQKLNTTREEVVSNLKDFRVGVSDTDDRKLKFIHLQRKLDNATHKLVEASKKYDNITDEEWEDENKFKELSGVFEKAQDKYEAIQFEIFKYFKEQIN